MKLTHYATGALLVITAAIASISAAPSRFGLTLSHAQSAAPVLQPTETAEQANIFREKNSVFNKRPVRVFAVQRGDPGAIIADFDATKGDKLRLQGFGLTQASEVTSLMREEDGNVLLATPGGPAIRFEKASIASIPPSALQLELDRRNLITTFADDFNTFAWRAEDREEHREGPGVWRTNYGWGLPNARTSRSLDGNRQVYTDPYFRGTGEERLALNPFHIVNGILEIHAEPAPEAIKPFIWGREYTSGLITNKFSFSQLYGVFEIRARLPKGRGFWPAFWLLPADSKWPPELDVFEVLCHETNVLHTTAHSQATGEHTAQGAAVPVADLSADFHQYAVDWQKDEIRWYLDGVEVARAPTPSDMHKPMYMLANLGVGGDWPGDPDASTPFPGVLAIDWIRAYRRDMKQAQR
jgi:beta-glucanase (GH16 family)